MPLEQTPARPAPWPPLPQNDAKGRVPEVYPVGGDPNESFWSIASKTGVEATDLVRYNFLTNKPEEINWYLKNYVGCRVATSDGKNYKFTGVVAQPAANKGVIFIPRAAGAAPVPGGGPPAETAPTDRIEPIPESDFQLSPWLTEIAFSRDLPEERSPWIVMKASLSGKGKFGPDSKSKVGMTVSDGKLKDVGGDFVVKNFLDTLDLKVGFKWKLDDMTMKVASSPKKLAQKIGEALEATFNARKIKISPNQSIDLDVGATASATPFLVKFNYKYCGKTDAGPALGLPKPLILVCEFSGTLSFKIGPGPSLLQAAGRVAGVAVDAAAPAFVAAVYVGFMAFGIWYTTTRADRRAMLSWYVRGYLDRCCVPPVFTPHSDPEVMKAMEAGRQDAVKDANQFFPGQNSMEKWAMIWTLAAGGDVTSIESKSAGRRLLGEYLTDKMRAKYGC